MRTIAPCLWFDTQAEEAANFYTSVFPDGEILAVSRFGSAGPREAGLVMTVSFRLHGLEYLALNGGPEFTHSEALSLMVHCDSQDEVDYYWDRLVEGGGEHGPCGWLKDRFGLSWQVVPDEMLELFTDPDEDRAQRAVAAMLTMSKLDLATVRHAADEA